MLSTVSFFIRFTMRISIGIFYFVVGVDQFYTRYVHVNRIVRCIFMFLMDDFTFRHTNHKSLGSTKTCPTNNIGLTFSVGDT